jgi:hypothetical protein
MPETAATLKQKIASTDDFLCISQISCANRGGNQLPVASSRFSVELRCRETAGLAFLPRGTYRQLATDYWLPVTKTAVNDFDTTITRRFRLCSPL